jgi:hypothetical protein
MDDVLDQIDQTTETTLDTSADDQQLDTTLETQPESQQPTSEEKGEWRRVPSEWSKAIKELRELYPDRADMLTKLRDGYGRYAALSEVAPKGLDDVRQWKTTLDALGGSEAAAELMQRTADMEAVDARIESGDYSVLAELSPEWQKGFYQMLPDALTDLSEKDPNAFASAVQPHFQAALAGTGLGKVIDNQLASLNTLYASTTDPEARATIKQLYQEAQQTKQWYDAQTKGAGAMPNGAAKTVSPELARAQKQLETYQQGERQQFVDSVLSLRNKTIEDSFKEHVAPYVKQLGLSETQVSDLRDSFAAKIEASQVEGTPFFKQLKAYSSLKTRDKNVVDNFVKSATSQDAKTILDGLVTARYGGMRKAKPSVDTGTKTTDNGAVRVAQAPPQEQWDMGKMEAAGYEATVKKGIFYLQGNRTVQLARPN